MAKLMDILFFYSITKVQLYVNIQIILIQFVCNIYVLRNTCPTFLIPYVKSYAHLSLKISLVGPVFKNLQLYDLFKFIC